MNPDTPITEWADRLEAACAACPSLGVRHVRVMAETASTQDAAWNACGGSPGWLVIAGMQTAGRGRLGRTWVDSPGGGVAMTLVLPQSRIGSVAVGVAVARAVRRCVPEKAAIGLRWPNDVVERTAQRKLAGVLIEVRDGVSLVGIGVNVRQQAADFAPDLRDRAVSVLQLGGQADRLGVAEHIVEALGEVLGADPAALAAEATSMDTLIGTRRSFVHDGTEVSGVVMAIDVGGVIRVRVGPDRVAELPAATTSLVHE